MASRYPFTTFNFKVELTLDGESTPLSSAAFAECDGLEITMQPKTYQEGGNLGEQIHLVGPVSYGQLTLKRGMTDSFDLWTWLDRVVHQGEYQLRASGVIVMLSSDGQTEQVHYQISRCLPVKIKGAALNAKDGQVAIEELQIVYERLQIRNPQQQNQQA